MSSGNNKKQAIAFSIVQELVGPNPDWDNLFIKENWKPLRAKALQQITAALKLPRSTSTANCYFAGAMRLLSNGKRKRKVGGGRKHKVSSVATLPSKEAIDATQQFLAAKVSVRSVNTFGVASL